jgi:outer membrane protein assembly factor BamB
MPTRVIVGALALLMAARGQTDESITLKGHGGWIGAVAFSPDSRQLAIGAGNGTVCIWNAAAGEKTATLAGHADAVAALTWSADGSMLASSGHDGAAIVHRLARDGMTGKHVVLRAHTGAVLALAFAPGGQLLFSGGIDGTIREWDTQTNRSLRVLRDHSSWINGLTVDRSGILLASASSDQTLQMRAATSFEPMHTFRVKEGEIRSVAVSPDGKVVAAGLRYGGVRVWDVNAKKEVAAFKAHEGETWALAFTPDGKTLASGGGDWNKPGEVRLWDVGTWRERAKLEHTGEVLCLAISPDGRRLAAGSWDRTVRIWKLDELPVADWPHWRGPSGMGIATDKDLPLNWGGKGNLNVRWKSPLPGTSGKARLDHNQSSPIVSRDRVFLIMVFWPEGVAQSEFPEHHVVCNRADGKQLWDTKVPPGPWLLKDLRGGYSAPTPCSDGERVYALFGSSTLAALDFDGKIVWQKDITPYAWDVAIGASPVLYRDAVLVLADGTQPKQSRLIAFDTKTGAIKWERARPNSSFGHSTPLLVDVNGKPQLLVSASGTVQGLDPADGKPIWWANNPGDVPTPVFAKGLVYSESGRGGPGMAVDPTGSGDVTKSHVKWKTAPVPEGYSSPVIVGDYVYRQHNPGILKCWSLADGKLVYSERLPNGVDHAASPIVTPEGRIYFVSGGKSAIIAAGPKYEVLAVNDLGDASRTSPAVANGRIYIKGGKNLYCIGAK